MGVQCGPQSLIEDEEPGLTDTDILFLMLCKETYWLIMEQIQEG